MALFPCGRFYQGEPVYAHRGSRFQDEAGQAGAESGSNLVLDRDQAFSRLYRAAVEQGHWPRGVQLLEAGNAGR